MSHTISEFLAAPDLPLKIRTATDALEQEARMREHFRDAIQPHEKGEFINGETIIHSTARDAHNHVSSLISRILGTVSSVRASGLMRYEKALCGFSRNDYEPDIVWFGPGKCGTITPATMVYPVPDLIVEIVSPSTEARDRGVKFEDYAAHGVAEYWIVDPDARSLDQFVLPKGAGVYRLEGKFTHGAFPPRSFPNLSIPLAALFEDDANLAFVREILK